MHFFSNLERLLNSLGDELRIVSVGWADLQNERLPNVSSKMRQLSLPEMEFLSQAPVRPRSLAICWRYIRFSTGLETEDIEQ